MAIAVHSRNRGRDAAEACTAVIVAIGAAALAGWATDRPVLLGLRARYIPMAPNTAMAFVVLGLGLLAPRRRAGGGCRSAAAGGRGDDLPCSGLVEYATGRRPGRGSLLPPRPDRRRFGLAPVGKMALFTAAAFVAAGASIGADALAGAVPTSATSPGPRRWRRRRSGWSSRLGYLFSPNAPLLYGTQSIPMALNTAIGFVGLGAGLVAAAGPGAFPLRRLSGPSTRARLLRVFLPLVVATVGLVAWLTHAVSTTAGASSAAISSAALADGGDPRLRRDLRADRRPGRPGPRTRRGRAADGPRRAGSEGRGAHRPSCAGPIGELQDARTSRSRSPTAS